MVRGVDFYLTVAATCCSSAAAATADEESSPLTIFSMDLSSLLAGTGGLLAVVRACRCDGDMDDCRGGGCRCCADNDSGGGGGGDVCSRPPLVGDWRSSGAGGGVLPADEHRPGVTVSNAEPTDDGWCGWCRPRWYG